MFLPAVIPQGQAQPQAQPQTQPQTRASQQGGKETLNETVKRFSDKYGAEVIVRGNGLANDPAYTNDLILGAERVLDEFPQGTSFLRRIGIDNLGPRTYANASRFTGESYMGTAILGKGREYAERKYAEDVAAGFHPAGTNLYSTMSHEMGHIMEGALYELKFQRGDYGPVGSGISYHEINRAISARAEAKDVIHKAYYSIPKAQRTGTPTEMRREISGYAMKNHSETIAEAIADYSANGNNAKPLSVAIWQEMKKRLG